MSDQDLPLIRIEPAPLESALIATSEKVEPTAQEFRAAEINAILMAAYLKAGQLVMTTEETQKLTAEFPRACMERRENRFVYIPHIHISRRLTEVFGPGQWTMIRRREWIIGNQVNAEWVMIIRGHFVGESIGSQEYHPSNPRQNFADVLEATRGECIRRIAGKYLGCGGEAWDPAVHREMDTAKMRQLLQRESPASGARTVDKPAASSSDTTALHKRLWKITERHHNGNPAALDQWMWDEAIMTTEEKRKELSVERLEAILLIVEQKMQR